MLFYSEILNKHFKSAQECADAEKKETERLEQEKRDKEAKEKVRTADRMEVEKAQKAYEEARSKYYDALRDYTHKYGSYVIANNDGNTVKLPDFLSLFNF